jgi:hypothetical protein
MGGPKYNWNGSVPAPPAGNVNVLFQSDYGSPIESISAYVPIGAGGAGLVADEFAPNGSTTTWGLSQTPTGAVLLFWNGVAQEPGVDFTVVGTTLTTLTFTAPTGSRLFAVYGSASSTPPATAFDPLDPTEWYWREDWTASPAGILNWSTSNWVAGSPVASIVGFNNPNFFRAMKVASDGASNHGSRAWIPIPQALTTGAAWRARFSFQLISASDVNVLLGFGNIAAATVRPLPWLVGLRYDTTLGDTDFMVGLGASDGSSGTFVSTGVAADLATHDLLMIYVDNDHVSFSLDGGSPIVVANTPLDGGLGVNPGLWGFSTQNSFQWGIYGGLTAFQYLGLTR